MSNYCFAVRPFITDDARVVGRRLAQWEIWMRMDKYSGEQWHMFAFGPNNHLELAIGGVLGYDKSHGKAAFTYALPLIQGKVLFNEYGHNKPPALGLAFGTFVPGGRGELVPPGFGAFSFLTVSQCIGEHENVLIHGNFGGSYMRINDENGWNMTAGLGTQIKAYKGFHLVAEIFYGDPYAPDITLGYQVGFRHFINNNIQFDATIGSGLNRQENMPFWGSAGIRMVTERFLKESKQKREFN